MTSISRKDQARIEQAANAARNSSCVQRLGAVLVSSGRVMAVGHNSRRNRSQISDPYGHAEHAEAAVLRMARTQAQGATLYVARVLKDPREYGNAAPCSRCMLKMIDAGVSRVVFTSEDSIVDLRISKLVSAPYRTAAAEVRTDPNGFYRNVYIEPQFA